MKLKMKVKATVVALLLVCFVVQPASAEKIPVIVEHQNNDSLGQRLIYQIKEITIIAFALSYMV